MYAISTLLLLLAGKVSCFSSIVEQLLKLCTICKSPLHGPRNYVDLTWERSANYSARTFSSSCYRAMVK